MSRHYRQYLHRECSFAVAVSLLLFCALSLGALALGVPASAQNTVENSGASKVYSLGNNLGMFSEVARIDFAPSALHVLVASNTGVIRRLRAGATPFPDEQLREDIIDRAFLLAAPFALDTLQSDETTFFATFFLSGKNSSFATTKIKRWTLADLKDNSAGLQVLTRKLEDLRRNVKIKQSRADTLEEELTGLRKKASKIAGVSELIDLKLQLDSLQGTEEERTAELERLDHLVSTGRRWADPEGIDTIRQELGVHLKEAAKATSVADRLNRRKSRIAEQGFRRKLRLINEMKSVDMAEMAQKVLSLRRRRHALERRLKIGSVDEVNDQF